MSLIKIQRALFIAKGNKQDFERRIVTNVTTFLHKIFKFQTLAVQKLESDLKLMETEVAQLAYSNYEEAKDELGMKLDQS